MHRKKKILFVSEAAYLNTGYAKYSKEVISRIYNSGKYDIAEFSIYGGVDDTRRSSIPWKNYPNMPDSNNQDQINAYNSNPSNQFGAWRFDRICLDFEPDIVLSIRDFWMDSFIYHSPFRKIFSWAWMPTVDASPQNQEWIDMFSDCNYVLTYSDWARKILQNQGGNSINTVGVASPSADSCFVPMDKNIVRSKFNLRSDMKIIGTVMRNQRRKLFPILIESFGDYLKMSGKKDVFLYLHTSFPDAGWNIADLIHQNNVSSRVLMTYVCEECKNVEVSFFRDSKKICNNCRKYSSVPSSVGNGATDEVLSNIYNLFDLYIQCANSEGFGLPQVEAAACGIPIACTNYSAMEDIVNKLNAYPIKCANYKELETGCDRAVPEKESILEIFNKFFSMTDEEQIKKSNETRYLFEQNYSWDKTAEQWMNVIEDCEYADWKQPLKILPPINPKIKEDPSTYRFVRSLFNNHSYYEPHKNSHFMRTILTDLIRGFSRSSWDGFYTSEFSPYSNNKPKPINREMVLNLFNNRINNYNGFEEARLNKTKLKDGGEKWLN